MSSKKKQQKLTSVRIKSQVLKMMERYVRQGEPKSELINEALRQYLIEREFEDIRQGLIPLAQAKGIYTDEDIEQRLK